MSRFYIIFLTLFLTSCSEPQIREEENVPSEEKTTNQIEDFTKIFKGEIDNKYEFVMRITLKENRITGDYFYTKYKDPIRLSGSFDNTDNSFSFLEFSSGEDHTGEFKGMIDSNFKLNGTWTSFSKAPGKETSFSFYANEIEEEIEFQNKKTAYPFHPYHLEQLTGMGDTEDQVDISEPFELPEGYDVYERENNYGYTIDYGEEFNMRTPYFEYSYLGNHDSFYYLSISQSGGGTGIFSHVGVYELSENRLKKIKTICGGDRCDGGVMDAYLKSEKLFYVQNASELDVYYLADSSIIKDWLGLESCPNCCLGLTTYTYDLNTKEKEFIYFEANLDYIDYNEAETTSGKFLILLKKHLSKANGRLNQEAVNKFVLEFNSNQ